MLEIPLFGDDWYFDLVVDVVFGYHYVFPLSFCFLVLALGFLCLFSDFCFLGLLFG